ncbi:signal peptidase I [Blastococcus sp. HT6-30]|uniref:signal peptidase I n=1 Tax=Blastococcus sp. HT6-30 TaxID=3144843 RepID=UPI00321C2C11
MPTTARSSPDHRSPRHRGPCRPGGDAAGTPSREDVAHPRRVRRPDADPVAKRVVAFGGESVAIEDGTPVVDGVTICEPWSDPAHLDGVWFGPVEVPDGSVFLLGDQRDGSIDSRVFGPVGEDGITGVVVAGAWPLPRTLPTTPC